MKRNKSSRLKAVICLSVVLGVTLLILGSASAQRKKIVVFVSSPVGTSRNAMAITVGEIITKKTGLNVRVEPRAGDVEIYGLLRSGGAEIYFDSTNHTWYATQGLPPFDTPAWGPQKMRILIMYGPHPVGIVVRRDSGIKNMRDLKGKRVPYYPTDPGITDIMEGSLAFANLTYNDVIKVPMNSFIASLDGVQTGIVDAAYGGLLSGKVKEVAASPHGAYFIPLPLEDKVGWGNLRKLCPYLVPMVLTSDSGIPGVSDKDPLHGVGVVQVLECYDMLDNDLAYTVTKTLIENVDSYKSLGKFVDLDLNLKVDPLSPFPYHPGAIKYYKEAGTWGKQNEEHQRNQIRLEEERIDAWKKRKR